MAMAMTQYMICCKCRHDTMILAQPEMCDGCGHEECRDCEEEVVPENTEDWGYWDFTGSWGQGSMNQKSLESSSIELKLWFEIYFFQGLFLCISIEINKGRVEDKGSLSRTSTVVQLILAQRYNLLSSSAWLLLWIRRNDDSQGEKGSTRYI